MRSAFLFPGQGARNVPGAVAAARATPTGAALLRRALDAVALDDAGLDAMGGRALEQTRVLQPVLTAVALAAHAQLRAAGLAPAVVLGHSLGELAAWAAAGAFSDEAAVDLAARRGALMAEAAAAAPGGLVALPSLEVARAALEQFPVLDLAAVNAPDEVVVCGPAEALAPLARLGGRAVPVSGPWHGRAMRGAVEPFRAALAAAAPRAPRVTLVRNADGARAGASPLGLADQLAQPVQFVAALETLRALGVDTVVTVGPGLVLRGLVRRVLGTAVRVLTTEDAADLDRTVQAMRSAA